MDKLKHIFGLLNKAGFNPNQRRDAAGRWRNQWGDMLNREQMIKGQGFETALVYDKDGNLIAEVEGDATSVSLDDVDFTDAYLLTHNHPNDSSFSRSDIFFLLKKRLGDIRAIGPNGIIYNMEFDTTSKRIFPNFAIVDAWQKARDLAQKETESYLIETLGKDWQGPYWKDNEAKILAAQKIMGRWSDRVNYHLANSTDLKDVLTYTVKK